MKETTPKKPYVKPAVTRIKLDAKCAVLGFCKGSGLGGPGGGNCTDGGVGTCLDDGS
jgi:hypothetical protein